MSEADDLRAELERRHAEHTKALNRRVDVENSLVIMAKEIERGERGPATPEELRSLAIKLGVSPK